MSEEVGCVKKHMALKAKRRSWKQIIEQVKKSLSLETHLQMPEIEF